MQRKLIFISTFIVCFIAGLATSHWWSQRNSQFSSSTVVFEPANPMPEFNVINHNAETVDNSDLKGRWGLMFFGFTNCPDVCPNTLNALTQIQSKFVDEHKPQIILVSVDPMRDTPELVKKYINTFSSDIKAYTGELHQIQALTDKLGVAYAYNALPDGSYTVDHSAFIFIINPAGLYTALFTDQLNSQNAMNNLANDYGKLVKAYE